jgi:hypothetical protein
MASASHYNRGEGDDRVSKQHHLSFRARHLAHSPLGGASFFPQLGLVTDWLLVG